MQITPYTNPLSLGLHNLLLQNPKGLTIEQIKIINPAYEHALDELEELSEVISNFAQRNGTFEYVYILKELKLKWATHRDNCTNRQITLPLTYKCKLGGNCTYEDCPIQVKP
jgi:hypothetical protein